MSAPDLNIVYDSAESHTTGAAETTVVPATAAGFEAAAGSALVGSPSAASEALSPAGSSSGLLQPGGGGTAAPSIDLSALEREAEQLTQQEVETLLSFLAEYYTIDLVRLSGGSTDSAKEPTLVAQQQQLVQDILKVEGCAQCLGAHTYDHDDQAKADEADKTKDQIATSKAANDAFILLGCKLLHCRHVVHVLCVLKLQAKLRAAAANGSVAKMILPTLDLCHSTSFFRVIAFPIGTQSDAHTTPAASKPSETNAST